MIDKVIVGDTRTALRQLPANYVDCVVTSPPYFQLRDYQHGEQLGLEAHVDEWVEELREVMREIERVLVPTGTVWFNLGDRYSTGREGAPRKSLLLGPERFALAVGLDGWIVRNKVVWAKRNPMPSPVPDRLTCSWEVLYLLTRSPDYFFDLDAIRVPHASTRQARPARRGWSVPPAWRVTPSSNGGLDALNAAGKVGHPLGKNPGDVWPLSTASYRGAHHAVFPLGLIERPIRVSCPERRCRLCRRPWRRQSARQLGQLAVLGELRPSCRCGADWEPGIVLDPFMGSGTTAIAAEREGRRWLGVELNPTFARLARERIIAARVDEDDRRAA